MWYLLQREKAIQESTMKDFTSASTYDPLNGAMAEVLPVPLQSIIHGMIVRTVFSWPVKPTRNSGDKDDVQDEPEAVVTISAVGVKDRNRLRVAGREFQL